MLDGRAEEVILYRNAGGNERGPLRPRPLVLLPPSQSAEREEKIIKEGHRAYVVRRDDYARAVRRWPFRGRGKIAQVVKGEIRLLFQ